MKHKKDLFDNKKPVQIESNEFWFNGNIIQLNNHPKLKPFVVFKDKGTDTRPEGFFSYGDAVQHCLDNPVLEPDHLPKDFGV